MNESIAKELARVVNTYQDHPNTRDIEAVAIRSEPSRTWVVNVWPRGDRYDEVPEYLPLTANPCTCRKPYCASGHVATHLLDKLRAGQVVPV